MAGVKKCVRVAVFVFLREILMPKMGNFGGQNKNFF